MAARRRRFIGAAVAVVVTIGVLAATGVVRHDNASTGVRSVGSRTGSAVPTPAGTIRASSLLSPHSRPASSPTNASLSPVLSPLSPGGNAVGSDPAAIAAKVASAGRVRGGRISAAVMSAGTGTLLYDQDATSGLIPASVTKLLTTSAALRLLGPQHRFRTAVLDGGATTGGAAATHHIVLVGGGDPYLTATQKEATAPGQASLEALAASTVKELRADNVTEVRLGYDASLFSGPAWNPTWPTPYKTVVTPTSALWVDEGRLKDPEGRRQADPATAAAKDFAGLLRKAGIKIIDVSAMKAGPNAAEIAGIDSLPLSEITERLVRASDNDAAEVVARQVAIADGRPGTIIDALNSIRKTLAALGVWAPGTRIYDGSGLSRDGRIPAETLVKVLRLDIDGDHPWLESVITGLPVAGVEGSLRYRFGSRPARVGRGLVRAKTGTLTGVRALAGYAYTRDGELLIFAFVVNGAKSDYSATLWLDRASAAVASCGCIS